MLFSTFYSFIVTLNAVMRLQLGFHCAKLKLFFFLSTKHNCECSVFPCSDILQFKVEFSPLVILIPISETSHLHGDFICIHHISRDSVLIKCEKCEFASILQNITLWNCLKKQLMWAYQRFCKILEGFVFDF